MTLRKIIIMAILFSILSPAALMAGDESADAKQLYTQGETLLKQGDLKAAFKQYSAAAKADPQNTEYAQQAMLIRRVIMLRGSLDSMEISPRWEKTLLSLHAFYITNGIYGEALALDKLGHEKLNNAMTASLLAETLLEMDKNEEALGLLEKLDNAQLNKQNRLYLGITLARLKRMEEATKIRDTYDTSNATEIGFLYDVARITALLGDEKGACTLLATCFENTPPSQLGQIKTFVKECRDFSTLEGSTGFTAAMSTASKIVESSCSGGTSCGSCPNRNQCGSQDQPQEVEKSCDSCEDKSDCSDCKDK